MTFEALRQRIGLWRQKLSLPVSSFFNPVTTGHKILKWSVITLILTVGVILFTVNLKDISAHEKAYANPVTVEATICVKMEKFLLGTDVHYTQYLSYEYNGHSYQDIFYRTSRSPLAREKNNTVITVVLDPNDPFRLAEDIISHFCIGLAIFMLAAGIALTVYGILIEHDRFWHKRLLHEQMKYLTAMMPDYFKDVFMIFLCVFIVIFLILYVSFPYTFGLASLIAGL